MKLKQWPTDEQSYLQAIRQITKFIRLFKDKPGELEDYAEATEIYHKLLKDVCTKYNLRSSEEFWKWCYNVAAAQLDVLEERLL